MGAERMDRQRRLAERQLDQRPAFEFLLYRKARQEAHPKIARHALLDAFNTPQFDGVLHGNAALAQGTFKICRNTHWGSLMIKLNGICCRGRRKSTGA